MPRTSRRTIFNLNKYRVPADPAEYRADAQSNATVTSREPGLLSCVQERERDRHWPLTREREGENDSRNSRSSSTTYLGSDYAVSQMALCVDLETHMADQRLAPVVDPSQLPDWDDATLFAIMTTSHYLSLIHI